MIPWRMGGRANTLGRHLKVLPHSGMVRQNRAGQHSIPAGCLVFKEDRSLDYGTGQSGAR